jgi:hypothetical protein
MDRSRRWALIVAAVAAGVVVSGLLAAVVAKSGVLDGEERAAALRHLPQMFPPANRALGEIAITSYREYRANAVRWSAVYWGCVFGSAFLSALAALILKLDLLGKWPRLRNDVAAGCAVFAALLVTLSTSGDFQSNWQANRTAAAEMESLAYDLVKPRSDDELKAVVDQIRAINLARNGAIVARKSKDPAATAASEER